jgi:Domain of unknown function (DUF4430)
MQTVNVSVLGGPSIDVPWIQSMTALQALEGAHEAINATDQFTFAMQYYGKGLGYLVIMINETYDSFISRGGAQAAPFFYWEFLLNEKPAPQGVAATLLNAGDRIRFEFEMYSPTKHKTTSIGAKHSFQTSMP